MFSYILNTFESKKNLNFSPLKQFGIDRLCKDGNEMMQSSSIIKLSLYIVSDFNLFTKSDFIIVFINKCEKDNLNK